MKTAGIIVLLIGLLISGLTGRAFYKKNELKSTGIKVMGTVVRFEMHESSSSSGSGRNKRSSKTKMYAPVVTFKDQQGADHELTSSISSSSKGYEVGGAIPVYYPAGKPEEAELATTAGNVFMIIGIVLGLILVLGGGALFVRRAPIRSS